MAATPYRAMTFMPYDLISTDTMNQEVANIQWLFENTPRVLYTTPALKRAEGVKIACGKVAFQKRKSDTAQETVDFGNFFSRNCNPSITTGTMSNGQRKIFVVYSGLHGLQPNHQGFRLMVEIAADKKKKDKIAKQFWVSWIAMGY
jgi:hypothetical protein